MLKMCGNQSTQAEEGEPITYGSTGDYGDSKSCFCVAGSDTTSNHFQLSFVTCRISIKSLNIINVFS